MLKVIDNGRGISEEQIAAYKAFGLMGMNERAYSVGGDIKIKGIQGKGTTITLCVPLGRKEGKH